MWASLLTTPMDEPMERRRLTDARVSVEDMTDGGAVALAAGDDGMFVAPEGFGGVAGHRYRLTVERDGMSFAAESEMLAPTVITDMEFEWIKMPYDHVAVLQVTFEDDQRSSGDCYWVRVYRNGEPYRWSAVDDRTASGGYISEVIMTTRRDTEEEGDDDVLLDGDTVTVTVAPISQDMHDYLSALMSGGSNGPRMFSGDFCLGYFLAASTDSRVGVTRFELATTRPQTRTLNRAELHPATASAAAGHRRSSMEKRIWLTGRLT